MTADDPKTAIAAERLVLGTAQLGMQYGIANKDGRPDPARAAAIVQTAWEGGIRTFDTAQAYGESEAVLGRVFSAAGIGAAAGVVTKLDPDIDHGSRTAVEKALEGSLSRLGVERLQGLMLHQETMLDQWQGVLGKTCRSFVRSGRVERLGASVYSPQRAIQALGIDDIDFVQVPTNLFDRRFAQAGVFSAADRTGKQVFVRSVFLQGLLLLSPEALPGSMGFARPVLAALSRVAAGIGRPVPEIALGYVRDRFPEARVIFGAETASQVRENLVLWHSPREIDLIPRIEEAFAAVDETLINPSMWPERRAM